ncbi:MAG: hypothetical protein HY748_00355 [Elusimicrobia bacterium]|nr:hypothetical protein [Elusimicrobiota bacterium]
MKAVLTAGCAAWLAACVPFQGPMPSYESRPGAITTGPFEPLDPGASELDSLHFSVRAYGSEASRKAAESAEESYKRVMLDTNLYSFRPKGLYRIVVYATADEFRKKTEQPSWSGGVTVGNAIYTFHGPHLPGVIAHEMTHLVFHEYMGRADPALRWVNEGLAVHQEAMAVAGPQGTRDPFPLLRDKVRQSPLSMDHMIRFVPLTEAEYQVNAWYAQAYSMVRFMIERGGRIGFSQFLAAVKDGRTLDEAVGMGFPGGWRNLAGFEAEWQRSQ